MRVSVELNKVLFFLLLAVYHAADSQGKRGCCGSCIERDANFLQEGRAAIYQ